MAQVNEQDRNNVLAECAAELETREAEWMDMFYSIEDESDPSKAMAFYNAMECTSCAERIRMMSTDYADRKKAQRAKIAPWVKAIMRGDSPGPLPRLTDDA